MVTFSAPLATRAALRACARFPFAPARSHVGARALRIAAGVAVLTVASRLSTTFAGTLVPFTLQPQAVLLVAATLGAQEGTAAVLSWFALALGGWAVFAGLPGTGVALLGPTAGYLVSYLVVAPWVGRYGRGLGWRALGHWGLGTLATLALGTAWLSCWVGVAAALTAGFGPFLLSDAGKAVAVFAARRLWAGPSARRRSAGG